MKNYKQRVYFDYNLYEDCAKGIIKIDLDWLKANCSVYLSVAIIEEYYKAEKNCNDDNKDKLLNTYKKFFTLNYEKHILVPGNKRILCEVNTFEKRYQIIKNYDTQKIISKNAIKNIDICRRIRDEYIKENATVLDYSNSNYIDIWDKKEVKKSCDEFPKKFNDIRNDICSDLEKCYGIAAGKTIKILKSKNMSLRANMFYSEAYPDFLSLQIVVDYLYEALQECGFHTEKRKKAVSGVYDVSHIIYASYCDYLVTSDSKLIAKANAIYYYLGISTRAINVKEFMSLSTE